jgi:hypothetical protein
MSVCHHGIDRRTSEYGNKSAPVGVASCECECDLGSDHAKRAVTFRLAVSDPSFGVQEI